MCDLIDLSSPDSRKLQSISKLASPLIPGPVTPVEKTHNIDFVSDEKRPSLDNNPFDKVFKESSEYAAKRDDPFESVLEKAQQNATKETHGHRYKEDFTPKRRRHSDVLKMNKTLEEPLLQGILNKNFNRSLYQNAAQGIINDLNSANFIDDDEGEAKSRIINGSDCPNIIIYPPSPRNSSVLNNSMMNDSLSEGSGSSGETETKVMVDDRVFTPLEKGQDILIDGLCSPEIETELLKPVKLRRSFSQGNRNHPESPRALIDTLFRPRSKSIVDTLEARDMQIKSRASSASSATSSNIDFVNNAFIETGSMTSATSSNIDFVNNAFIETGSMTSATSSNIDFVNNAFIETGSMTNSESFNVSKISADQRLSSCGSVGSLYSYGSKNRAFILDSQSSKFLGSTSSAKSSLNLSGVSRSTAAGNFPIKTPLKTPVRIADLELRLEKLKIQSQGSIGGLPLYTPNHKVQSFLQSDQGSRSNQEREAKLIDTDGFLSPFGGEDYNGERTDSVSNCSCDSVFENHNVDRSVFKEAKSLARTFDELAQQSGSNSFSSGDDLLFRNPRWNFDVLPVSDDDEPVVDNLIELPVSPPKSEPGLPVSASNEDVEQIPEKKLAIEIRELETEFIDQDVARNKVMAATLLLDLEKIVHRENNPEAITLLENLEKVLGVNYESNAQLLATCMQGTNNLDKSPKKFVTKFALNENIRHESLEKSDEDNNETALSNSVNIPKIRNDENLGINLNTESEINKSEKSITTDVISAGEEEKQGKSFEKSNDSLKVSENEKKEILVDQTEALELITNLSKILGGPNNDSSPLSLLTNLRQVLNLATNQLNFENSQTPKSEIQESPSEIQTEIIVSQKKPQAKPKLDAIKTGRKKSSDSSPKIQGPIPTKRSMSFSGVQRNDLPAVLKEKTKPHSRSFKKSLSCDAVPKPDKLEKISSIVPEVGRSRASTISSGTGKYKLKKKMESESVAGKKGPLKALLPVGNMQRRGSMSAKVAPISLSRTPPRSSSTAPSSFQSATSSTPNPSVALIASGKSPKTKPVASSTPDGGGSKARKIKLQFSKNTSKPKFSCNISPVTPLPTQSITGSISAKGMPKNHRHNKTLSPPKRRGSQEAPALNTTESSIPKYSPLSGFSRRNSKESVKTLDNSGSPKTPAKSHTPKKSQSVQRKSESNIPQSPLKTMNNQSSKFKPLNLISKLRRGSTGGNVSNVSDKENCT